MHNKKIFLFLISIAVLSLLSFTLLSQKTQDKNNIITTIQTTKKQNLDPKNATYTINGQSISLVNGVSSSPIATRSAEMITTKYFGNEVLHDFDGDGRDDTAFLLTQQNSGSGTFYYVVVALNTAHGYVGSTAFFLGDRIAPQTTEMSQDKATPDVLIVNFADRKATDAFTVPPSIGKSVRLKLDTKTMQFGEVVKDFEGEANPSSMTLTMKSWGWVKTTYNNNTMITPKIPSTFILTFTNKATFSASTDCNGAGGEYSINGTKITLTKMMSTMMYCEGSQEQDFTKMLQEVNGYLFTSKGELILTLKNDSGSMIFK